MMIANTQVLLNGWVNALSLAIAFCLLVVGVASAQQNGANTNPAPVENTPSRHKIAFAKITGTVGESEKTASCVIVWLASEPSTKPIYCRYELEKDTNFLRDDDNGINPDKVVNLYSSQDQNDFEQRIQAWFKNKLQLNLAQNELQLIAKLMMSSTTFSPNSLFAIQPPARYDDFVLPDSLPASDKTNAKDKKLEEYKTFAAEVHRFIPEKMAEIAENIPNNPVPTTESTPNFQIAFAKVLDMVDKPEKTASCVIVLLASEPSTKPIYCRYELEKDTNFLRDDDNGINPDKVVNLYSSQDQNDFEQRIQAWFKNKLQLNLAPNERQLIAKLMSSSTFSPNSLFVIQPPARYEFVLPYTLPASDKTNAKEKRVEEYKTFVASVHGFIPKKMAEIAEDNPNPAITKNTLSLKVAFAKVLGTVRESGETASCVIVSSTGAPSDKNVYCRYKYPIEGLFFDSEDGLNLSVVKSDSVPNIQKHFIDWFTTKYPQYHYLMINDVNEILAFMSNEAQEFPKDKTVFGKKPETILLTKFESLTTPPSHRNDLKNAHQNQFAWLVHQAIGGMIVPNLDETPAKTPPTDNKLVTLENVIIWLGLGIVVIVILALLWLLFFLAKKNIHLVTELCNNIFSAPDKKSSQRQKQEIDSAALRQDFEKLREEVKNARLEHRKLVQQITHKPESKL